MMCGVLSAYGAVKGLRVIWLECFATKHDQPAPTYDQEIIQNLKVLYRAHLLYHSLLCFDNKGYTADLPSALNILSDAWKAVLPTTVANCFKRAGFCVSEQLIGNDAVLNHCVAEDVNTVLDVSECLVADLCSDGMDIPTTTTFREFAGFDNNLFLCIQLTNDEIVHQVLAQPETDYSDDDLVAFPQPSTVNIMKVLSLLLDVYSESTMFAEMQAGAIARKRNMKQCSLTDFSLG